MSTVRPSEVTIKGISKSFPLGNHTSIPVLTDVSFAIQAPAIVSVVGFNGTGKTTLLRILAGVLSPDSGTVSIDGAPPGSNHIGYVPQSNPVFPWLRIDDDITLPLQIKGVPRAQRRRLAADLVDRFSFNLPLDQRTMGLSGGQRQLVNLCRALVGDPPPRVLLLDEPFSALDPIVRQEFIAHLQEIRRQFGLVTILTTHYLDLAVLSSDFIIPFRQRPVIFSETDMIRVPFSFPRSLHLRTTPEYQSILCQLEEAFERSPHEVS